ncbi:MULTISPECIES: preprotein translocase subunit SecY [Streptomyces]|uniref:Protein translocase subunit SecY n=2 Tax=Streptomyces rimosus subsp. rimosus TaxID=132474 RepID=L8EUC7_STRR1|nr:MULTISPECIES: preprotein translocase subunit SecY [Streptomyces]KOG72291.1 preprotein translocase subunit SecY [Kitasatospora aureofaciens]MYT43660.1 preprotein translocase subunit SecY [Streptomyces sp. SID5471]KEF02872.1 preprotein translocase subunit SecY [Streptomyces rimosus]KUJ34115.1 preprotein translocase subunit SecY [Streptomyces rimosus subsp. rimosus]QDA06093.1 preprotein translocase subunit SecY [Streptomyces rimosus]
MLTAFARAFKTPDLRKKLLFTLGIVLVYRLGAHVPVPGVNYSNVETCMKQAGANGGLFGLVNMFSGGALLQITIFALGIMPYITASIILQLLTVVIPRLEALKKEGQSGQAKITQYTRYLTVALAVLQGTGLVATAKSGTLFQGCQLASQIVPSDSIFTTITMVITMTAGTAVVMWLGELVTDRGIGNGMSILMFVGIAAGFPGSLWQIKLSGKLADGWIEFFSVIVVGLAMVALVVFVEQAQRRIPVQYAKRMIGRRSYGGTSTYIPLKVNQAGVIPVIFASSLLYIPALVAQFSGSKAGWAVWIETNFTKGNHPVYIVTYFLLIVFFAFFYVAISFNPEEVADNMKKYGGFIPGIRAGRPTAEYLSYVLNRITWPGSLYLGLIALVPTVALVLFKANQNFPFGGTSILIIVGVGLETVKQIESQLQQRNYEGFLR